MSGFHFISIIGTQIFGTLNPLLSLLSEKMPLTRATFLVTKEVYDTAEKAAIFCHERGLSANIEYVEPTAESIRGVVQTFTLKIAEDEERCVFNMNGGTNQMIAGCSLALASSDPLLVQSTEDRTLLTDMKTGESRFCAAPECLHVREILSLQGIEAVPFTQQEKSLSQFCECGKLPLPAGALTDVNVGGVDFDIIWNRGNNRLAFLWSGRMEKGHDLSLLRNISHWASTRERSDHLFDRKTIAVVDSPNAAEHLEAESNGKIEIWDASGRLGAPQILRSKLEESFRPMKWTAPRSLQLKKRKAIRLEDDTLIVMLGRDPSATLLCVESHAPKHVVLCYTDTDDQKDKATKIREMATSLGLESLRLVPCDIEGAILPSCFAAPEHPETVAVNITPGTKGQGVFLNLWATRHKCSVWSIDHATQTLIPLDTSGDPRPLHAPDPLAVMQARGDEITTEEMSETERQRNDNLLTFLQKALHHKRAPDIFCQSVRIDGVSLHRPALKNWELHLADGTVFPFSMEGGEWMELLAARAFELAGAEHVHARVRRNGSVERINAIRKKYGEAASTFLSDMDVVGGFESGFFLVSCKSNKTFPVDIAAMEVRDVSKSIDRFTVPLLCHLGCDKPFQHQESGTIVFGWRELCQPDVLRDGLRTLRNQFKKINR